MPEILSLHEYMLRPIVLPDDFINAIRGAKDEGLLDLPEIHEHKLLFGVRGHRAGMFASLWSYSDRRNWESLWIPDGVPRSSENYPEMWRFWEESILRPFLDRDPDTIDFTAYEVCG